MMIFYHKEHKGLTQRAQSFEAKKFFLCVLCDSFVCFVVKNNKGIMKTQQPLLK